MSEYPFDVFCYNAFGQDFEVPLPLRDITRCGNVAEKIQRYGEEYGQYPGFYCVACGNVVLDYVANQ